MIEKYCSKDFQNEKAREFARHGFGRRLTLMQQCIDRTFKMLPPDFHNLPGNGLLRDMTIQLHAYKINAFGSLDNLAHVWVYERNVKKDGDWLPSQRIRFGNSNKYR
ncbi:MAG: hypothetical protein F4X92_05730 [Gammaproteobacteria bacterium]|nr:hypothetical protein [Gammaproteobacteria bacterium]